MRLGVENPMIRPRNTDLQRIEDWRERRYGLYMRFYHMCAIICLCICECGIFIMYYVCLSALMHVCVWLSEHEHTWNSLETTVMQPQANSIDRNLDFEPACTPLVKLQMIKSVASKALTVISVSMATMHFLSAEECMWWDASGTHTVDCVDRWHWRKVVRLWQQWGGKQHGREEPGLRGPEEVHCTLQQEQRERTDSHFAAAQKLWNEMNSEVPPCSKATLTACISLSISSPKSATENFESLSELSG